jgi:hypothetical protein
VNSFDLLFYRKLRERLDEERQSRAEFILNGTYTNLEDYKAAVGYLKAISDTLIRANEINSKLIGDTNNAR